MNWTIAAVNMSLRFCLFGVLATVSVASASTLVLNAPAPPPENKGETVMNARYRLLQTNWDQMIATSSNVTYGTIVDSRNLGTASALNGIQWDWSMSFTPNSGYVFTLSKPDTTSVVQWPEPFGSPAVSPTRSFNSVYLYAATYAKTDITSAQFNVTDLSFSGTGIMNSGSLVELHASLPPGSW